MMSSDEFYGRIRADIDAHGRHLLFVFAEPGSNPAFCYSIGNAEKGLPELLVAGIGLRTAMPVLNALSALMIERGKAFDDMETVDIGASVPVTLVDADESVKDRFTVQVGEALGIDPSEYRVQQVLIPDEQGRLPWNAGCAEPYRSLPVFRKGGVQ